MEYLEDSVGYRKCCLVKRWNLGLEVFNRLPTYCLEVGNLILALRITYHCSLFGFVNKMIHDIFDTAVKIVCLILEV